MSKSLSKTERWISLVGGGAVLVGAAVLLWRGQFRQKDKTFRGKWPMPEGARRVEPGEREGMEGVEEASFQSFPASDPPAFTPPQAD